jgi:hypothetical protein
MCRHQANIASMHNIQSKIIAARAEVDHMFPPHKICVIQEVLCFAPFFDAITGTVFTNITGTFPICSFKSMQHVFVAYMYDFNAIIIRATPSCTNASMVQAFTKIITVLKSGGYYPALNVMDNKCSAAGKKYFRSGTINIQLVPHHKHQVNAAERDITTFKENVITAIATVDMLCPLQLWDEFLP